jgi:hypothetical protein
MSDFSITRLDPITKSGDGSVQPSQQHPGSRHRRQRPYPNEPEQADDIETSEEEEKHDLDRLA